MVDFQYLPMFAKPSSPGSQDKEYTSIFDKLIVKNPGDIKDWLHNDVPLFLPPIIFSRMDMPMEYLYRSEMQHRAGFINPQDQRPSHLIGTGKETLKVLQKKKKGTKFIKISFQLCIIQERNKMGRNSAQLVLEEKTN